MLRDSVAFLLCVLWSAALAQAQQPGPGSIRPFDAQTMELQKAAFDGVTVRDDVPGSARERMEREQMTRMITERRAQLQRDTDKLVTLTAELKDHVAKAGPDILSIDVIKKAAEIQKLAKSVEDKMKNAY